jgi:hypothetical protein
MKTSQVVLFEKGLADRASMMSWDKGTQHIIKFTINHCKNISLIAKYDKTKKSHF